MEKIVGIYIDIPKSVTKKVMAFGKGLGIPYSNYMSELHITLHLVRFPAKNFDKLVEHVATLSLKPFTLRMQPATVDYNRHKNNYFIALPVAKTASLYNLHKQIITVTDKYRDSLIRKKDQARIKAGQLSKEKTAYVKKYGYHRILKFYKPHITIGTCDKNLCARKDLQEKVKRLQKPLKGVKFKIDHLKVLLVDYDEKKDLYGKRILKTIKF